MRKITFFVYALIPIAVGLACVPAIPKSPDQPIVITPVAVYPTQTTIEASTPTPVPPTATALPAADAAPTPTPTPWLVGPTPVIWPTAMPSTASTPAATTMFPTRVFSIKPVLNRGDRFGEGGTTWDMAYDGDLSTYFDSDYFLRQMIQIDFNTIVDFSGFRRYMTRDGYDATGNRGSQGEEISYSVDGMNWLELKVDTTRGWQDYTTDRRDVWRSVDYGWSPWLRPKTPVHARHVRFYWEDGNDAVNEIELDWIFPAR